MKPKTTEESKINIPAKNALLAVLPMILPFGGILSAVGLLGGIAIEKALEVKDIEKQKELLNQSEFKKEIITDQVKIAQEKGIAFRIFTAEDVEIEEFYEDVHSVHGKVGVNVKGGEIGGGRDKSTVTRRIYRFKGYNAPLLESYAEFLGTLDDQIVQELDKDKKT